MNSHLYRTKHKAGSTLYDKLKRQYTDAQILELIRKAANTGVRSRGEQS